MGLLSNFFQPADFNGKVQKLFKWYSSNTKFVSMGMFKDWMQLRNAILIVAEVLGKNPDELSYETIHKYGDVFGTVVARCQAAQFLRSNTLIPNTAENLISRYAFLGSMDNARVITQKFLDLI